jgi:hypothetical protein
MDGEATRRFKSVWNAIFITCRTGAFGLTSASYASPCGSAYSAGTHTNNVIALPQVRVPAVIFDIITAQPGRCTAKGMVRDFGPSVPTLGLATATEYPSLSLPALCRQRNIPPNHRSAWERQSDGTSLCPLVAERLLAANTRGTSCLLAGCSAQPVGDNFPLSQPHGLTEGHEKCAR